MARTVSYQPEPVPAQVMNVRKTTYACDGCGRAIDPEAYDGDEANELIIGLNQDQCVHFYRRRDYCTACLEPIWQAICKLIKSDPEMDGNDREDDD